MKSTHDEWTNTVVENERNTTDGHLSLFNTMHADAGWMLLFTIFSTIFLSMINNELEQ